MLNPWTDTSIFTWTVATLCTVKLLSLTAKSSDSNEFVQRNRFLRIGPASLNNIFSPGATISSTWLNRFRECLIHPGKLVCSQSRTRTSQLAFPWLSLKCTIQSCLRFTIPPSASKRLRKAFRYPPLIAFRRPNNLKDLLVRATLTSTPSEPPGNYPCEACRCKLVLYWRLWTSSPATLLDRFIRWNLAPCKFSNIVYLIKCRRCGLQYVGKTVNHSVHESMFTGLTSCTGGLTYPLWPSILIAEHIWNWTWRSGLLAVTHVYERQRRADGSGPWKLCPLREWISGLTACKICPSIYLLHTFGLPPPLCTSI